MIHFEAFSKGANNFSYILQLFQTNGLFVCLFGWFKCIGTFDRLLVDSIVVYIVTVCDCKFNCLILERYVLEKLAVHFVLQIFVIMNWILFQEKCEGCFFFNDSHYIFKFKSSFSLICSIVFLFLFFNWNEWTWFVYIFLNCFSYFRYDHGLFEILKISGKHILSKLLILQEMLNWSKKGKNSTKPMRHVMIGLLHGKSSRAW